MNDSDDIEKRTIALVAKVVEVPAERITPRSRFVEDLHVDSLTLVELVMQVETELGVRIPEMRLAELRCVGDVVRTIEVELASAGT